MPKDINAKMIADSIRKQGEAQEGHATVTSHPLYEIWRNLKKRFKDEMHMPWVESFSAFTTYVEGLVGYEDRERYDLKLTRIYEEEPWVPNNVQWMTHAGIMQREHGVSEKVSDYVIRPLTDEERAEAKIRYEKAQARHDAKMAAKGGWKNPLDIALERIANDPELE